MGIRVRHEPDLNLVGAAAYQTGAGKRAMYEQQVAMQRQSQMDQMAAQREQAELNRQHDIVKMREQAQLGMQTAVMDQKLRMDQMAFQSELGKSQAEFVSNLEMTEYEKRRDLIGKEQTEAIQKDKDGFKAAMQAINNNKTLTAAEKAIATQEATKRYPLAGDQTFSDDALERFKKRKNIIKGPDGYDINTDTNDYTPAAKMKMQIDHQKIIEKNKKEKNDKDHEVKMLKEKNTEKASETQRQENVEKLNREAQKEQWKFQVESIKSQHDLKLKAYESSLTRHDKLRDNYEKKIEKRYLTPEGSIDDAKIQAAMDAWDAKNPEPTMPEPPTFPPMPSFGAQGQPQAQAAPAPSEIKTVPEKIRAEGLAKVDQFMKENNLPSNHPRVIEYAKQVQQDLIARYAQ